MVQDQLALGSDNKYALCAAPNSTASYPHLPNCTLSPNNWIPPWHINIDHGAAAYTSEPSQ